MSNIAIQAENLGKQYRIGGHRERYQTLRDTVTAFARSPFRSLQPPSSEIWALKDVSFEIKQGEAVGIIGRNGAGKSTLLKVLSRITEPTAGRVRIKGRVASLLEVGTGFHPELTGRENILLNGAILGMTRAEIKSRFDEIVDFAEVEKFLDTPVKRYSSGMYVRLAFAVAAHIEPEILLVDEVLAVGDAEFQKKCLGKMGGISKEGRTVLFVSHNMAAVQHVCDRCCVLDGGTVRFDGTKDKAIADYLRLSNLAQGTPGVYELTDRENQYMKGDLIIKKVELLDSSNRSIDTFQMGQQMTLVVDVEGVSAYDDAMIGAIFKSAEDLTLAGISTGMTCSHIEKPRRMQEQARLCIPQLPFTAGSYSVAISVARPSFGRIDYVDRAAQFHVAEADIYGTGYTVSSTFGFVYLDAHWEIRGHNR